MKNSGSTLSRICQKRIPQLYPPERIIMAKSRLKYEINALSKISGGEQAFLETSEFVKKLRNLCNGAGLGYKPHITFRGPVLASLIAYLTGISEYDPIALGFDPWIFYEKPSVIEFNFNLPQRAIRIIGDYDLKVPESCVLYFGRDASVIEQVEECIPSGSIRYSLPDQLKPDTDIMDFFRESAKKNPDQLQILTGFDMKYVSHAREVLEYLASIDELPSNIYQLAKLDGFLHSSLYDEDYVGIMESVKDSSEGRSFYETLISYSEDTCDILVQRGCDIEKAKKIARKVKSAKQTLDPDDLRTIESYCGKIYVKMLSDIKHLYCKSQCFQVGLLEAKLIHLISHHRELTSEAYEMFCMQ